MRGDGAVGAAGALVGAKVEECLPAHMLGVVRAAGGTKRNIR